MNFPIKNLFFSLLKVSNISGQLRYSTLDLTINKSQLLQTPQPLKTNASFPAQSHPSMQAQQNVMHQNFRRQSRQQQRLNGCRLLLLPHGEARRLEQKSMLGLKRYMQIVQGTKSKKKLYKRKNEQKIYYIGLLIFQIILWL